MALNLEILRKEIHLALSKETTESLTNWLKSKRMTTKPIQKVFDNFSLESLDRFIQQNESIATEYTSTVNGSMNLDKNPDQEIVSKIAYHLNTLVDIYRVSGQYRYKTVYKSKNVNIIFSKKIEVK